MPVIRLFRPASVLLSLLLLVLFVCFAGGVMAKGSGPKLPYPGFRSIGVWQADTTLRMDVAVWYPSARAPRRVTLAGWLLTVSKDSAVLPGKYPAILISHDAASSRFASHDLAAILAQHGFIVIAPTHPGDNADNTSRLFRAANFAERPRHLLAALEAVKNAAAIGPFLDTNRIGVLGVGSGAATALQLAGATPDLALLALHCPPSTTRDPLCANWSKELHPQMQREFSALIKRDAGMFIPATTPPVATATPERPTVERTPDAASNDALHPPSSEEAPSTNSLPWEKTTMHAVGLLTPGLVDLFPDAALHSLGIPIGIVAAPSDTVYPSDRNGGRLLALLPQSTTAFVPPGAGHFSLQAPCPPMYQESFAAFCDGRPSSEPETRNRRSEFLVQFFQRTLGLPAPPP